MVSEIAPKRRRLATPRRAQIRAEGVRASEREAFQRRSRKRDVAFSLEVRKPAHAWPISPARRTAAFVKGFRMPARRKRETMRFFVSTRGVIAVAARWGGSGARRRRRANAVLAARLALATRPWCQKTTNELVGVLV